MNTHRATFRYALTIVIETPFEFELREHGDPTHEAYRAAWALEEQGALTDPASIQNGAVIGAQREPGVWEVVALEEIKPK